MIKKLRWSLRSEVELDADHVVGVGVVGVDLVRRLAGHRLSPDRGCRVGIDDPRPALYLID